MLLTEPQTQNKPEPSALAYLPDAQIEEIARTYNLQLDFSEIKKISLNAGRDLTLTELLIFNILQSEKISQKSFRPYLKDLEQAAATFKNNQNRFGLIEFCRIDQTVFNILVSHNSPQYISSSSPQDSVYCALDELIGSIVSGGARALALANGLSSMEISHARARNILNATIEAFSKYSAQIGLPTLAGSTYFDQIYDAAHIFDLAGIGLIKQPDIVPNQITNQISNKGYDIILVGKATDVFSHMERRAVQSCHCEERSDEAIPWKNGGIAEFTMSLPKDCARNDTHARLKKTQETSPFLQKHLIDSTYDLFVKLKKQNALNKLAFSNISTGGIAVSVLRMIQNADCGAQIDLEKIHTLSDQINPATLALAETSERYLFVCHPKLTKGILEHYNKIWDLPRTLPLAQAKIIGKLTTEKNFFLKQRDNTFCSLDKDLFFDFTAAKKHTQAPKNKFEEPNFRPTKDFVRVLEDLLKSDNIASRQPILQQFDKNIQGITLLETGQADAGIIAPLRNFEDVPVQYHNIALSLATNSTHRQALIDPLSAAAHTFIQGLRNTVSVGAVPLAFSCALNVSNPADPEQMWSFSQAVQGIVTAIRKIPSFENSRNVFPCIQSSVSAQNCSSQSALKSHLTIMTIGKLENHEKHVSMSLKHGTSVLMLIGERKDELGGSEYYRLFNHLGANVPKANFFEVKSELDCVLELTAKESVLACHTISRGGLAVALLQMAFENEIGFDIDISATVDSKNKNLGTDKKLFSESGGFVLEIPVTKINEALSICQRYKVKHFKLGRTKATLGDRVIIRDQDRIVIDASLSRFKQAWLDSLSTRL